MPDQKARPSNSPAKTGLVYTLQFTPAEWRQVIDDVRFLLDSGNSYQPRRLMGIPVEIIPDHRFI
jgi:hypothetical protein